MAVDLHELFVKYENPSRDMEFVKASTDMMDINRHMIENPINSAGMMYVTFKGSIKLKD